MPEHIITVPAFVDKVWFKKKFHRCYLNMNKYRNWNYILSDKVKKRFYELVESKIKELPKMAFIESITYTLIVPNKKKRDRMNVYSVVDKFFCDALQKFDIIKDDSDENIGQFLFTKTIYEKGNEEDIKVRIEIISYLPNKITT